MGRRREAEKWRQTVGGRRERKGELQISKDTGTVCHSLFSYVKRILNWFKHKEETEEDVYARWEKDFDLIPLDKHGLFSEYLELGEF